MPELTVGQRRRIEATRLRGRKALEEIRDGQADAAPKPAAVADIKQALAQLRTERSAASARYRELSSTHYAELTALRSIEARGGDTSAARKAEQNARTAKARQAKQIKSLDEKIAASERKLARATTRAARPNGSTRAEEVYTPESEHRMLRDLLLAAERGGTGEAMERLERHQKVRLAARGKDLRESGSTQGQGYLPPSFWSDYFVTAVRPSAVIRSAIPVAPLPDKGDLGEIPAWTGGSSVAVVGATGGVNDAVSAADGSVSSAYVTANLTTLAANWDVDRQVFERVRPVGEVSFARDLEAAYDASLDLNLISGDGTNRDNIGLLHVSGAGSYDGSSASTAEAQLQALAGAAAQMFGARHALPEALVLHPKRWLFLQAALSSAGAPLLSAGGVPASGIGSDPTWSAGVILGMKCLLSDQIAEGDMVCWRPSDSVGAFEETLFTFPQVGSGMLSVRLQCYGLSQTFLHRVPESVLVVSGLPATGF